LAAEVVIGPAQDGKKETKATENAPLFSVALASSKTTTEKAKAIYFLNQVKASKKINQIDRFCLIYADRVS
jgi:hypothetical protein